MPKTAPKTESKRKAKGAKPWILMLRFDPAHKPVIQAKVKKAGDTHPAVWARRMLLAATE